MSTSGQQERCVIVGGGPAGLTAAWDLARAGVAPIVLEKDSYVGGISRTVQYKGYRFDIGGHRFFTKVDQVNDWWMDVLKDEFLLRPRLSRIFYNDVFFDYPLKPVSALRSLGIIEAGLVGMSYLKAQLFPHPEEANLEQWVSNRFGYRLYSIFFKTYTEKVWGMKCTEIGADWAAQRIKNLDLKAAVKSMFISNRGSKKQQITTLIEQFHYPKFGPGQMWEKVRDLLGESGHPVQMGHDAQVIHMDGRRVVAVTAVDRDGNRVRHEGEHFISTMPIRELIQAMDPPPPPEVLAAANSLRYRDFLTVGLVVNKDKLFPDNWIYIHSDKVKVGRIQNFGNWSPFMIPEEGRSCIGLEYFVQEGDELWSAKDEDLIELGKKETDTLGLINAADVVDGVVIRQPKAYPVYDGVYKDSLATLKEYLQSVGNLHCVGRNGLHRYNNQDHSMLTAMYAAENILGKAKHDVWEVNLEEEYHEEKATDAKGATGERLVPQRVTLSPVQVLEDAFAKYDPVALGAAMAVVFGLGLFLATAILVVKGGPHMGTHLSLLNNYIPGYSVTWPGAFVGLILGAVGGFLNGWTMAVAINAVVTIHLSRLLKRLDNPAPYETMDLEV
ncbi:MAG: NAD(P)/FAD-dependent oxidoreductase [Deltaproteobacteria bacterium]|nr:NAD(P)/FAD-dependent oxidoreductase [Deltaproteobacteria bacterium]